MVLSRLVFVSLYEGDELLKYFSLFFSYVYIEKMCISTEYTRAKVCIRALIKTEYHAIHFNSLMIRLPTLGIRIFE